MSDKIRCRTCDEDKEESDFTFVKSQRGKKKYPRPDCKSCVAEKEKAKYRSLTNWQEVIRERNLLRLYSITLREYDELFENQCGVCAVCGNSNEEGSRLVVDHDHLTGKIRGLLCCFCNTGLGYFRDNPVILQNAITYLKEHHD